MPVSDDGAGHCETARVPAMQTPRWTATNLLCRQGGLWLGRSAA